MTQCTPQTHKGGLQRKFKSGSCLAVRQQSDPRYFTSSRWASIVAWFDRKERRRIRAEEMSQLKIAATATELKHKQQIKQAQEARDRKPGVMARIKAWFGRGGER